MITDYSVSGEYFDSLFQDQQSNSAIDAEVTGSGDGYDGLDPQHPDDSAYMSGFTTGKLARTLALISNLEKGTNELLSLTNQIEEF